jgi:uroporphyrinogen III methyltransferase/synthase
MYPTHTKRHKHKEAAQQPLAGRTVAVTRAREQAKGITKRLAELGAQVVECPAIAVAPVESYLELDRAIGQLPQYDWVIFTSVNGVQAFTARMADLGFSADVLHARKLGAIGPATAAALEKRDCPPAFVPDTYVAEAIVEQIGDMRGRRVLLPRADIARKALGEGLRQRGAHVDEVTAYRTVPGEGSGLLADLLREGRVDAITFTSSSTVRFTIESLAGLTVGGAGAADLLNRTQVVCIGPVTAATAAEHGLRVAKVAAEYTSDGLVDVLVELFGGTRGGQDAEREQ